MCNEITLSQTYVSNESTAFMGKTITVSIGYNVLDNIKSPFKYTTTIWSGLLFRKLTLFKM